MTTEPTDQRPAIVQMTRGLQDMLEAWATMTHEQFRPLVEAATFDARRAMAGLRRQIGEPFAPVPADAPSQPLAAEPGPAQGADPTGPQTDADEPPAEVLDAAAAMAWPGIPPGISLAEAERRAHAAARVGYRAGLAAERARAELAEAERDAHAAARNQAAGEYRKLEALVEHYRHRGEMTPSERQSILGETPEQARQPEAGWIEVATRHIADNLVDAGAYGWWAEQAQQHSLDVGAVLEIAQALAAALVEHGRPFSSSTLAELRAGAGLLGPLVSDDQHDDQRDDGDDHDAASAGDQQMPRPESTHGEHRTGAAQHPGEAQS